MCPLAVRFPRGGAGSSRETGRALSKRNPLGLLKKRVSKKPIVEHIQKLSTKSKAKNLQNQYIHIRQNLEAQQRFLDERDGRPSESEVDLKVQLQAEWVKDRFFFFYKGILNMLLLISF